MSTDSLTTYLGLAQAVGTAAVTFYTTASADGTVSLTNPLFWLGMAVAVLMAVKGYFTNKAALPTTPPAPPKV